MAFDFSKLRRITPESIAADEKAHLDTDIAADQKTREENCKHSLIVTLTEMPRPHYTLGDHLVHFYAKDEKGRDFRGTYTVPYFRDRSFIGDMIRDMDTGIPVTVRGFWKKRNWKANDGWRQSWEFQIQFVEIKQG